MASKLIELADGTLVEVEVSENEARQISSREANAVAATFEKIKPVLPGRFGAGVAAAALARLAAGGAVEGEWGMSSPVSG